MLANRIMIEKYILRGRAEVRWNKSKRKPKHFDLLRELKLEFKSLYSEIDERLDRRYSEKELEKLILNIDSNLPKKLGKFKLSDNRKMLMLKLIHLRIENVRGV